MTEYCLYFVILLWGSSQMVSCNTENTTTQKNKIEIVHSTMAPNSKFLNPYLDDDTNLQFAIAAFGEEPKETENKAAQVLTKILEGLNVALPKEQENNLRTSKALKYWKIFPLFRSVNSNEDKSYKLK